jgi:hypothetical protein
MSAKLIAWALIAWGGAVFTLLYVLFAVSMTATAYNDKGVFGACVAVVIASAFPAVVLGVIVEARRA